MVMPIKAKPLIPFLVLIALLVCLPQDTFAQRETGYDLVNAVTDLRALHGLAPYTIDPGLMEYAQEHAEYQAAIGSGTHRHSDGSLPQDIGLIENVAGGHEGVVTSAIVVYEIWVDWGHRHTLIGYSTGDIGAGVALSENGQVYYSVDIRPGEEVPVGLISGAADPVDLPVTSTPNEDGSIIHTVKNGETLWSIAISYGVMVDDIRDLNGIPGDSTLIQIGQELLIRPANPTTPTPSQVATRTQKGSPTQPLEENPPSTVIPSPSSTAREPASYTNAEPLLDLIPSSTPPAADTAAGMADNKTAAIILIAVAVGLIPLVILGFRSSKQRKTSGEDK